MILLILCLCTSYVSGAAMLYAYTPLARFAARALNRRWYYHLMIATWPYHGFFLMFGRKYE